MNYGVIVIGGGPAGLKAACSAAEKGLKVLIIEREARLGGILKQCVHDGFGVIRFGEKLTGPEYAYRDVSEVKRLGIEYLTGTFVTDIYAKEGGYVVETTSAKGLRSDFSEKIVLATGCRERTPRQVNIHGTRPAGVLTTGDC